MNTDKLLIFGLGALVGYMFCRYNMQQMAMQAVTTMPAPAPADKSADCEKQWQELAARIKAPEGVIENMKAEFMIDCLSGTGVMAPVDMPPAQLDLSQI